MTRIQMIDYLDENYNTEDKYQMLEGAIEDIVGHIDDSDPDEGMYAELSDDDLASIIEEMKKYDEPIIGELGYTRSEYDALRKALEDFSDPAFTKDFDMSSACRRLLTRLEG